jgi:uncharacterized protein (TIGR03435 family)
MLRGTGKDACPTIGIRSVIGAGPTGGGSVTHCKHAAPIIRFHAAGCDLVTFVMTVRRIGIRCCFGQLVAVYLLPGFAFGQSNSPPLSFEAAEIQPNKSGQLEAAQILPSGQVVMRYSTLKQFIMGAYNLLEDRITGGPDWIKTDEFDLVAKAPPNSNIDDIRKMLQPLLAERFRLAIHHEMKVMPVYSLEVEKRGTKLQPATDPNGKAECAISFIRKATTHVECKNYTMAHLADFLPDLARQDVTMPVVDMTGIKGAYDITFDFMQYYYYNRALAAGDNGGSDPLVSIFDAIDKLGLKLEKSRQPADTIVIDSVQRLPMAK